MVLGRRTLAKNNDGGQTSSEVKPGCAGLVLGWVTTFKQAIVPILLFSIFEAIFVFLVTTILFL